MNNMCIYDAIDALSIVAVHLIRASSVQSAKGCTDCCAPDVLGTKVQRRCMYIRRVVLVAVHLMS